MIEGLEDIRAAAETLATTDQRLKVRLKQAGKEFWSAMYHADDWPAELSKRAHDLQKKILVAGTVKDTVAAMSREEAEQAAEDLLYLLVSFERRSAQDSAR